MYKFLIFLIVFTLFVFEIAVSYFFGKSLNSNALILMGIMILLGLFSLLKRDISLYHIQQQGSISTKIQRRRRFFYILAKTQFYAMIGTGIGIIYLGLFGLIGNIDALSLVITCILVSLTIASISTFIHILFTQI